MNDKLIGAAVIKYVCPICGEAKDDLSAIAINKRLTKNAAKKVESLHNQVVGFADKPCKECQTIIDQDGFFIIGVDVEKTNDNKNPYRSGHLVAIRKASDFYKSLPDEYKVKDACYMDYREMIKCGLIQINND